MTEATTTASATKPLRDRYEETDAAIMRAEGLMFAFYELWDNAACIDQTQPTAHSMSTLLLLMRETVEEIRQSHSRMWDGIRQSETKAA